MPANHALMAMPMQSPGLLIQSLSPQVPGVIGPGDGLVGGGAVGWVGIGSGTPMSVVVVVAVGGIGMPVGVLETGGGQIGWGMPGGQVAIDRPVGIGATAAAAEGAGHPHEVAVTVPTSSTTMLTTSSHPVRARPRGNRCPGAGLGVVRAAGVGMVRHPRTA